MTIEEQIINALKKLGYTFEYEDTGDQAGPYKRFFACRYGQPPILIGDSDDPPATILQVIQSKCQRPTQGMP